MKPLRLALAIVLTLLACATVAHAQSFYFETYALIVTEPAPASSAFPFLPTTIETTHEKASTLGPFNGSPTESAWDECNRYRTFYLGRGWLALGCRQ